MRAVIHGRKVVAAAGTPEALTASAKRVYSVVIQAEEDNSGDIVVGGAGVDETAATRTGTLLTAGSAVTLDGGGDSNGGWLDLSKIFIDAGTSGDGVHYTAIVRSEDQ